MWESITCNKRSGHFHGAKGGLKIERRDRIFLAISAITTRGSLSPRRNDHVPSISEDNLMSRWLFSAALLALFLSACGGGDDSSFGQDMGHTFQPAPITTENDTLRGLQAPVRYAGRRDGGLTLVGYDFSDTNVFRVLPRVPGRPTMGYSASEGESFLQSESDLRQYLETVEAVSFSKAPVVYISHGTSSVNKEYVREMVQWINTALPHEWKLRLAERAAPDISGVSDPDVIQVTFAPARDWWRYGGGVVLTPGPFNPSPTPLGQAASRDRDLSGHRYNSNVLIDHTHAFWDEVENDYGSIVRVQEIKRTIVHELLHALGFTGHLPEESISGLATIMGPTLHIPGLRLRSDFHELPRLDREALSALYTYGDYRSLGDWNSTLQIEASPSGTSVAVEVGVRYYHGVIEEWAYGPRPSRSVAESLQGDVTWSGELVGFTPTGASVIGGAEINLNMSSFTGMATFDELESWATGQPPGIKGTGSVWGDGDLEYSIMLQNDNVFVQTGGDHGILTGAVTNARYAFPFLPVTGDDHRGVVGILERTDLGAAFYGVR